MKKQTPETDPRLVNTNDGYTNAQEEARRAVFQDGLFEERTREFGGNVISVVDRSTGELAVTVRAVGNEAIAGGMQGEDITLPDRETYPTKSHHIDVEAKRSRASKVDVSVD